MDSHPVPQNVTSFEFHLIGDMTIRQFAYLASGLAIAYLLFITIGTKVPLIAWPLILFFSLSGVAFAFVPISERPLSHWVSAFVQAIIRPTQRTWQPTDKNVSEAVFPDRLRRYLLQMSLTTPIPAPAPVSLPGAPAPQSAPAPIAPQAAPPPPKKEETSLPSAEELSKTVALAQKAQHIQEEIVQNERDLNQIKSSAATPGVDTRIYTDNFQKVLDNLKELTQEASEVSHEMAILSKTEAKPATSPKVVVVTPKKTGPINLVLSSTPNIINGVVTDAMGNYLEGVIVVTHDKQGLPVRALKTNKLGQFVAATPLPNGIYTVTLEKENLVFDTLQVELDGNVMLPILIQPKKGGIN